MEDRIKELLEGEYEATLDAVINATDEDEKKDLIREMETLHKQLMDICKLEEDRLKRVEDHDIREEDSRIANMVKHDDAELRKNEFEHRQKMDILDRSIRSDENNIRRGELELRKAELKHKKAVDERDRDLKDQEIELRRSEIKSEKRNRFVQGMIGVVSAGTGIASLVLSSKWLATTMRFEETGTFTSKSSKFVSDIRRFFSPKG